MTLSRSEIGLYAGSERYRSGVVRSDSVLQLDGRIEEIFDRIEEWA
jgi:Holliday junction resolvasome RuvABC endonuclease subunit